MVSGWLDCKSKVKFFWELEGEKDVVLVDWVYYDGGFGIVGSGVIGEGFVGGFSS